MRPPMPAIETTTDTGKSKRTAGWVLVGVGGAALIGNGITFLLRQGAKSDLESACPGYESGPCPESSRSARAYASNAAIELPIICS